MIVHHPNLLQELTVSNTLGQLCQGVVGSCQLPQTCEPRRRYGTTFGTAKTLGNNKTEKWWFNQGKSWTMLVLWCLMHGISSNFISVCWRYVSNFISVCVCGCVCLFEMFQDKSSSSRGFVGWNHYNNCSVYIMDICIYIYNVRPPSDVCWFRYAPVTSSL